MSEFISISSLGIIRILGVPFGVSMAEVKEILEAQKIDYKETDHSLSFIYKTEKLPPLNVIFYSCYLRLSKEQEGTWLFDQVHIWVRGLSKKECNKCFKHFKAKFNKLFIRKLTEDDIVLFNTLYDIFIDKRLRDTSNIEDAGYVCRLLINQKYNGIHFEKINKEYSRFEDFKMLQLKENKFIAVIRNRTIQTYFLKATLLSIILMLVYLFVLNDRYYIIDKGARYFDKWTKQIYIIGSKGNYYAPNRENQ